MRVVSLDDVLWQIEDQIKRAKQDGLDKPTESSAPLDLNLLTGGILRRRRGQKGTRDGGSPSPFLGI